jgi:alkanesulfonate monooxygenase SsuD/methylene tetrahydromethanopterin reductase-like flavin-dependent oxidoreductase (luciferase family)
MMERIWKGEAPVDGVDPVGPKPVQPGGPEVLLGGSSPPAIERIGRLGYGFLAGGGGPPRAKANFDIVMAAREKYGQRGTPRFVALTYFGISDSAVEGTANAIRHYYSFVGPGADAMARAIPAGAQAIKDTLRAYEDIGVDEVMFYSGTTDISEVDRLAELVA